MKAADDAAGRDRAVMMAKQDQMLEKQDQMPENQEEMHDQILKRFERIEELQTSDLVVGVVRLVEGWRDAGFGMSKWSEGERSHHNAEEMQQVRGAHVPRNAKQDSCALFNTKNNVFT